MKKRVKKQESKEKESSSSQNVENEQKRGRNCYTSIVPSSGFEDSSGLIPARVARKAKLSKDKVKKANAKKRSKQVRNKKTKTAVLKKSSQWRGKGKVTRKISSHYEDNCSEEGAYESEV